jgi:hypothetical protein
MLMNAKALVALKAEMQQEAEVIWGSDEYEHHCTMQFEPRRTFDDQMEGMGEIMSAGFEDMEDSLVDIVRGVKRVACAASAPKLQDEPQELTDYNHGGASSSAEKVSEEDEKERGAEENRRTASVIVIADDEEAE